MIHLAEAPRGPRSLTSVLDYDDARSRARRVLPVGLFEYIDGGAEDQVTMARNRLALEQLALKPRLGIRNPSPVLETSLFGQRLAMPVLTAPCGGMRLVHPGGDIAIARAAVDAGLPYVAPAAGGFTLEAIAEAAGPEWFQLYRFWNRDFMESLVMRAQAASYKALVVTMDTVVAGNREQDYRNGFSYNMKIDIKNAFQQVPKVLTRPRWLYRYVRDGMPFTVPNTASPDGHTKALPLSVMATDALESHSPSWDDLRWIRDNWRGPLIVKGVLSPEDARIAGALGADGVVVSNHGGRQLDGAPASAAVLASVVEAVGSEVEVLFDSGIRRGVDVIKALALGAKAVLIGRYAVWGLAIGGSAGVTRMLDILRADIVRVMRLMGCTSVAELNPDWLTGAATTSAHDVMERRAGLSELTSAEHRTADGGELEGARVE